MRNRFDYISKQIAQKALGPFGSTTAQDGISTEVLFADLRHEPDPTRQADRSQLGLLGRLADDPCLLEVYSQAPRAEEFRACLTKHLAFWQKRARDERSGSRNPDEPGANNAASQFLWVICARTPTTLLSKLKPEQLPAWPTGVYFFGDDILRVGIVVASELPRDRTSLLVRLMAGGPLLPPAIKELAALPPDAYERTIAEPILLQFQHTLGQAPSPDTDEQEFIMAMLKSWEEGKAEARAEVLMEGRVEGRTEGRVEGRTEGRVEGRTEMQIHAILTVLAARGIEVPAAARDMISSTKDATLLDRWLAKAAVVSSTADLLRETK